MTPPDRLDSPARGPAPSPPPESWLGMDGEHTLMQRLGATASMVLVLPFLIWISFQASEMDGLGPWAVVGSVLVHLFVDVCWVFWAVATVYIWWRPRWLRTLYLMAERKILYVCWGCLWLIGGFALVAAICGWLP